MQVALGHQQFSQSYWAATSRYAADFPALKADITTDVAVVGAGFTGLSVAHHLERRGRECVVLEANQVGWGASGRNGGMVVPRYKLTFPELERKYGIETALLMYRLAHEAVDTLAKVLTECDLLCGFSRCGHITPILNPVDIGRFEADIAWLAQHAGDRAPRMLSAQETTNRLGTRFYRAAYFEPRGGGIHPLEYCQALARSLSTRGVRIYCETPVTAWSSEGGSLVLQAGSARIRARAVVIATNGYTDLTPAGRPLRRRIVPIASALVATVPLDNARRKAILPQGNVATDAKRLTNYYRIMPDGRFLFGGRGGASTTASDRVYRRLVNDMQKLFPELRGVGIDHRWFGMVALTLDSLPHIGQLSPGMYYAMGYNGRGVALAALLGARLAAMVCGERIELGPIIHAPFNNIPFHRLRVPAKQVAISYMQLRDAIDL